MILLTGSEVTPPIDHTTGNPVEHARHRIFSLIQELEREKSKIIIPAPALSEVLVRAGDDIQSCLNIFQKSPVFQIKPFDTLAAVEVAAIIRKAIDGGDKRGNVNSTWAKVKYDRQIVSIAKIHGAKVIYSDDDDIHIHAKEVNIKTVRLVDIPVPSETSQYPLFFNEIDSMSEIIKDNKEA
ncbi:MAG: PIN domain-containing protein [Alphaproteobacteria bacterium]|nr:PIN domain-containing protein [Alphaproteobacteria bacterium]